MPPTSTSCARLRWRTGNRFRLLADGERFFPAMLAAIAGAERYVLLEMYLMESGTVAGRFVAALADAARRGVAVHLLLDGFGSRRLGERERAALSAAGVGIAIHNPLRYGSIRRNFYRDHRKLLLVDGEVGFVGGAGITDEFLGEAAGAAAWRETMVEVHGPCLGAWQRLFAENWARWAGVPPAGLVDPPRGTGEGQLGRVAHTRGGVRNEILRCLIQRARSAERRVWIATAYFAPSWKLRRTLKRAARRGVDVRLLLPGPLTDHPAVRHAGRRFYGRLLGDGVRIFEYQPRFMHQKLLLCDDWGAVGSANVDRWTLRWNLEANQEVEDPAFAAGLAALFEGDFAESREIDCDQWRRRSRWGRLLEWFWGRVDRWIDRRTPPP
ncbi:phospholipase D-like domain-containing protein [Endothiovibrio diazotrophicus]